MRESEGDMLSHTLPKSMLGEMLISLKERKRERERAVIKVLYVVVAQCHLGRSYGTGVTTI